MPTVFTWGIALVAFAVALFAGMGWVLGTRLMNGICNAVSKNG